MNKENDRLVLGVYDGDTLLVCENLEDSFPTGIRSVKVGIKWESHYHPWYETTYRLHNFYSTPLGRELDYPNTFKELYTVLECVLYEHIIMGTIGINDESGEFCILTQKGEYGILKLVRDILNGETNEAVKLPICCL